MDITLLLYAAGVLGAIGLIMGAVLTAASKKLKVEEDGRIEEVRSLLGGANCGACGYAGCASFAKAVVEGKAEPERCSVMSAENAARVGEILGIEVRSSEPSAARLICRGNYGIVKERYKYEGLKSCAIAASLAGGSKLCEFACLGLGDCVQQCKFGAISISDGIAVFDTDKCVACGECVKACPRHAIELMPRSRKVMVLCRNTKPAREAKNECQRACIGCGRCRRECPQEAITVENNLAHIDPEKCIGCGKCAAVCPCGCITALSEN